MTDNTETLMRFRNQENKEVALQHDNRKLWWHCHGCGESDGGYSYSNDMVRVIRKKADEHAQNCRAY